MFTYLQITYVNRKQWHVDNFSSKFYIWLLHLLRVSSASYSNMSTEQHVSQDKEWNFSLKDFSQRGSIWSWKRMLTCGKHSITQTCQGSVKDWRGNGGKDWSKKKSKTQKWERKRKEEGTDGVWKGVKGAEQMSHLRRHWKNGAWKNE